MKKIIRIPQILGAVLLLSCTTDVLPEQQAKTVTPPTSPTDPLTVLLPTPPPPPVDGVARMYQGFALTGEISAIPKADIAIPIPSQKAEMSALGTAGAIGELNYIALGGSLTAGFRDYGLTRESQQTAYPNLIAHQMGLINFKSPLFDVTDANGTGSLLYDGTDDMPSWKQVSNKTSLLSKAPLRFNKYQGGEFQNISIPFATKDGLYTNYSNSSDGLMATGFALRLFKDADLIPAGGGYSPFTPTLESLFKKQNSDIYTVEFGFDGIIDYIMNYRNLSLTMTMLGSYNVSIDKNRKVVGKPIWILMPSQIKDLPFFQFFTYEKLKKKLGVDEILIGTGNDDFTEKARNKSIFLPTKRITDAIKNKTPLGVVPDAEVIDDMEATFLNQPMGYEVYNSIIQDQAKRYNIPTVDLPSVYDKVLKGQYISEDGFKIDPSFPKGNFFSQDGIYPSAIGQAVIANEVIKVINKSYKTNIPLINLTEYARSLSR